MNTQYINLDISKALKPNRSITIGQGDLGGTTIVATIYDNGSLLSLSGLSARFFLRLPNSVGYVEDDNCTVSGNAITYVVDEEHCASVSGVTQDAYFALYSGTTRIYSTERFTVKILQSAADGVLPGGSWTNGVEEWLEDASETLSGYVSDSNARIGATINAANAAVEQMRSDVDSEISDAIEGTEDVIERAEDVIDAMGDISELAVPLMSPDTRGGAKLGDGLAVDDGTLHVGQLAKESTGEVYGPLASVTAKGHAEQFSTTGKNLRGAPEHTSNNTNKGVTWTYKENGIWGVSGTNTEADSSFPHSDTSTYCTAVLAQGTYTASVYENGSHVTDIGIRIGRTTGSNFAGSNERGSITFTANGTDLYTLGIFVVAGKTVNHSSLDVQLELGSVATEYEPYTGGAPSPSPDYPQEIQVVSGHEVTGKTGRFVDMEVQGKNLLDPSEFVNSATTNGIAYVNNGDGSISFSGTATANTNRNFAWPSVSPKLAALISQGGTFTFSSDKARYNSTTFNLSIAYGESGTTKFLTLGSTATIQSGATLYNIGLYASSGVTINATANFHLMLERGSVATPYEPYFRSTTPIPLPQRGWVGGLPDGTADVLSIDSAGKVEWTLEDEEMVVDGSSDENWRLASDYNYVYLDNATFKKSASGNAPTNAYCTHLPAVPILTAFQSLGFGFGSSANRMAINNGTGAMTANGWKTWLASNPVTVLYPLATPVTEECGYVDLPDIPSEVTVSIPELEELGLMFWVDGNGTIRAAMRDWYERAHSEYADRILALEEAVAEIVAG